MSQSSPEEGKPDVLSNNDIDFLKSVTAKQLHPRPAWLSPFTSASLVFGLSILLRLIFLIYGLLQDAFSPLKYTDIDYLVFTSAAGYVSVGRSPYDRATYRYTPLLAWWLLPTTWGGMFWFSYGKILFAAADIVAGYLIMCVLMGSYHMNQERALKYASIWLLNPMVATISTRGSSEGLLGVMVMALLWAVLQRRIWLAGMLLGLGVHFKIYPFIYGMSILFWLDDGHINPVKAKASKAAKSKPKSKILATANTARISFLFISLFTFALLNIIMYKMYGGPFLKHTYLHHLTRLDHRHNFSPYNVLLYLSYSPTSSSTFLHLESLAFLPQLFLSAIAVPLVLAKKDLPGAMLVQTWAFVAWNKVCTSQYFLWYLILLPFWLAHSPTIHRHPATISLKPSTVLSGLTGTTQPVPTSPDSELKSKPNSKIPFSKLPITKTHIPLLLATLSWLLTQAAWLHQGYRLEFLGRSSFIPGLWISSLAFFISNVWLLGIVIEDVRVGAAEEEEKERETEELRRRVDAKMMGMS
ncbi:MAG: GPI mannosyltransferase 1 [Cirrosporium novae-zelandiae]|nr:MAG: GPI mannosyltransferase 1 [Cirrosporium novae-zelandiae]